MDTSDDFADRQDNPSGSLAAFAVGVALIGAAVFLLSGKKAATPLVGLGNPSGLYPENG